MLKDKDFIGRVCRMTGSDSLSQLLVTEVIRSNETVTGFVATPSGNADETGSLGSKGQFEFLINNQWVNGADFIISLLEVKIRSLRRELKIRSAGSKNAKTKNGKNSA